MKKLAITALACLNALVVLQTKSQMLENSDVIALVEITDVNPPPPKFTSVGYTGMMGARYSGVEVGGNRNQQVKARVKQTLVGETGDTLEFLVPCAYPRRAPQIQTGVYLVFLAKGENGLRGNNWQWSYRPFSNGRFSWYKENAEFPPWEARDAETVLNEIKQMVKKFQTRPWTRPSSRCNGSRIVV